MAFHSEEKKVVHPHSPRSLPPSRSPTFASQRSFIYHTLLWACRLQDSSHWQDLCAVAALMEASAVPDDVWVISWNVTPLYIPLSSAPRKKAWGDKQQTALCSASTVKRQPSPLWIKVAPAEWKMPGICNPRTLGLNLWSISFFSLLGLVFTAQCL